MALMTNNAETKQRKKNWGKPEIKRELSIKKTLGDDDDTVLQPGRDPNSKLSPLSD
jgi:hypothetical protein